MRLPHSDRPSSADLLGPRGPFAGRLAGFVPRPSQQDLASHIERVLLEGGAFIAESGTGTGKTFAYLVPALLSGRRVLISTGTKALQDQIYRRDLPQVRELLERPVTTALLKGRANYLCLYRLQQAQSDPRLHARGEVDELACVQAWAARTRQGDIAEVDVPEDSAIWPLLTSTADNCLGGNCPRYTDCYVVRARREALAADVVVINHHLFFADLVLREEGFGQLLPVFDAIVFDEAHQLPEIATTFFSLSVGSHQLTGLARDTVVEDLKERSSVAALPQRARALEKAVADARVAFGVEARRAAWPDADAQAALSLLHARLVELAEALAIAAGKGEGLANCHRRARVLLERLALIFDGSGPDYVRWFEVSARGFILQLTALDVAHGLRPHLSTDKAWIFTSATLTIGKRFDHYRARMGLEEAETAYWESPFDYAHQTLLYVPADLPHPGASDYTRRVVDAALPVLVASGGRAFVLFTSHRALREAAALLAARLQFPLLVQGSAPRTQLLERFRSTPNAVLLGTSSFWEGVDVRGEALSCVIIDKLPFASPDDPVLRARCEALAADGRNPFLEYQLPNAVIALKQGVGRLIRDEHDRGLLMLCDPRLLGMAYGRTFLESLPPMPLSQSLEEVQSFFAG